MMPHVCDTTRCHRCPDLIAAIKDGIRRGLRSAEVHPIEEIMPGCWGTVTHSVCTCPPDDQRAEIDAQQEQIDALDLRIQTLEKRLAHVIEGGA